MPVVYVLVGVPGSGKSTWVSKQEWMKDYAYISTDKLVEEYAQSVGKTYDQVFKEYMPTAVKVMIEQVKLAASQGKNIVWDQTSTNISSRKKKFVMLPDYYHIAVMFKTPPEEELTRRLNSRVGKSIPKNVIEGMIRHWENPTEQEGYKEIWYAT